jgi:two-component sensor histidine kinase
MKKVIQIALLFLFANPIIAQELNFHEITIKENLLKTPLPYDSLATITLDLYDRYYYLDSAKSREYLEQFYQMAKKNKDEYRIGQYHYYRAYREFYQRNFENAIDHAYSCAKYMKEKDHFYFLEAEQLRMKSLFFLGDYQKSEEVGKSLIQQKNFEKQPIQLAKIYYNTGLAARQLNRDISTEYFHKAVFYLKINPDNRVFLLVYHALSEAYQDRLELDSAMKYAELAYEFSKDTLRYNEMDILFPLYNYHRLLKDQGNDQLASRLANEIQAHRFFAKVEALENPFINYQVSFLEYLRNKQEIRFIVLISLFFSIVLLLVFVLFFNQKLKIKEQELSVSLALNKKYFQETHLQVKNNFQIMMNMLNLEAMIPQLTVAQMVEDIQSKISNMARIHEMFLEKDKYSTIDTQQFLEEVIFNLQKNLDFHAKKISINFDSNGVQLTPSLILTLALIINELVNHAVQHAFKSQGGGHIELNLEKKGNEIHFTFQDNGTSWHEKMKQSEESGVFFLNALIHQIQGTISWKEEKGTRVHIHFADHPNQPK